MPKTRISEYSATNSSNTDIEGINIDEGCAPSGINNAIRELMVHLKEFQTGASGDAFTFAGGTLMSGTNTISGAAIISGNINSSGTNTFSGSNVMSFSGGSSASPSIYFASDTNTGIFSPAADTIAFTEGGAEAMRIDASGNLLVGVTATDAGAKTRIVFGTSQNGVQIKDSNDTSNASFLIFQNGSNSNFATISRNGTNNSLKMDQVSAITFPATQVASADANTLDDYEEGTFTLTLSDSSNNNATMGSNNVWRYIKVGRTVTIAGTLDWTSASALSAGSRIRLTGLPFASDGTNGNIRSPVISGSSTSGTFNITTAQIKFGIDGGNTYIWGTTATGNNVDNSMVPADLGNSGTLYGLFVTYLADA